MSSFSFDSGHELTDMEKMKGNENGQKVKICVENIILKMILRPAV